MISRPRRSREDIGRGQPAGRAAISRYARSNRAGGTILLAVVIAGCASHRAPDLRPTPPARVEARLKVYPAIGIAGQLFTLLAELVDPRGEISCPSITWTWPNG